MIKKLKSVNPIGKTIMFFGRSDCRNTTQGLKLMLASGFDVYLIINSGKNDKFPSEVMELECDYIICFRSWFILSQEVLDIPKSFAINLHPGPPNYPGSGCVNFAIYNDENNFGVTTHIMEKQVDSGSIIDYELFPITKKCNLHRVLISTHQKLFNQLNNLIVNLAAYGDEWVNTKINDNKEVHWTGKRRKVKELIKERQITFDMDETEINKRIRAFHHPDYPIYVEIKGKRFYYNSKMV